MKSVVSERGQVTIPKKLRDRPGIYPGQELEFRAEEGRLVAFKVDEEEPVEKVFGMLQLDRATDEILMELRGPVDAVEGD